MLEELLGWENNMVNKTNNNTKSRNSNNETTAAKRRPPHPLDLRLASPGLGSVVDESSYLENRDNQEEENRRVAVKRRGGAGGDEEEEDPDRKRQRSSTPPQPSLPSLPLFTKSRLDHPPPSSLRDGSSSNSVYSPNSSSAPTYTLTPPLTPNTPQAPFTHFAFPQAAQNFPYNQIDNSFHANELPPKPLESLTNNVTLQPYPSFPSFYSSDALPRQQSKYDYPQNTTLYYNPSAQQGHQNIPLWPDRHQQQEHQGAKQPRTPFPHLGSSITRQSPTSTQPLVGVTLLMEKTLGSVRRWRENGATIQVFYCCVCSMPIDNEDAVVSHVRSQHGHSGPECFQCGQNCENEEGLARHALTHKVFVHKNRLNQQRNLDTNFHGFLSQTNVCRGCGKKFNTEELLGFHEKECVQCRPHRCEFCGQGFIVAARLKHHRRNCQANPVPTTHACKVCSRSFPNLSGLQMHVPVHAFM